MSRMIRVIRIIRMICMILMQFDIPQDLQHELLSVLQAHGLANITMKMLMREVE